MVIDEYNCPDLPEHLKKEKIILLLNFKVLDTKYTYQYLRAPWLCKLINWKIEEKKRTDNQSL
jgi:hypothetical protein